MGELEKVAVLVPTYRRTVMLEELLGRLFAQETWRRYRVVVVDNDDQPTARAVCERYSQLVTYVHQPQPGLVSARNTALRQLLPDEDAFLFVDDDETVPHDWIERMCGFAETRHADVVTGPVLPRFSASAPTWAVAGGFWERRRLESGTQVDHVATNNTLVRAKSWRNFGEPLFNMAYNFSGGEDVEFFERFAAAGGVCVWNDDVPVHETVPDSRTTVQWVLRRALRIGNMRALRMRSPTAIAVGGLVRLGVGTCLTAKDLAIYRRVRARGFQMAGHGLGMLAVLAKKRTMEYARVPNEKSGASQPASDGRQ